MRLLKFVLLGSLCMNSLFAKAQKPLNVMTFNLRLNTADDSLNAWPYRKDIAASQVTFFDVDILGVQEALYDQMGDLQQRLPRYKHVGVGREDGKTKGEFSAIFYDTARFFYQFNNDKKKDLTSRATFLIKNNLLRIPVQLKKTAPTRRDDLFNGLVREKINELFYDYDHIPAQQAKIPI